MLNLNLLENLNISCSCWKKPKVKDEEVVGGGLYKNIYEVTRNYRVSLLPIQTSFEIENLYPLTDHVELWNIFIVGNDKTYILANIKDSHIVIPGSDKLPNKQGKNVIPDELEQVLSSIWDRTLTGVKLQFYMVWNGKLYFVNTYPFQNGRGASIGAIMFMRAFETMPDILFKEGANGIMVPNRLSNEFPHDPITASMGLGTDDLRI